MFLHFIFQQFSLADNLAFLHGGAAKTWLSPPKFVFAAFLCPIFGLIMSGQPILSLQCKNRGPNIALSSVNCTVKSVAVQCFDWRQCALAIAILRLLRPSPCNNRGPNIALSICQILVVADNIAFCDGGAVKMWMSPPKFYFRVLCIHFYFCWANRVYPGDLEIPR